MMDLNLAWQGCLNSAGIMVMLISFALIGMCVLTAAIATCGCLSLTVPSAQPENGLSEAEGEFASMGTGPDLRLTPVLLPPVC